jgi:cellulose synthase operon protein C
MTAPKWPSGLAMKFSVKPLSLAVLLLAGCASKSGTPDNEPTLASLVGRSVAVAPDAGIQVSEEKTIAAYRKFLETNPNAPQRPEAMRRLGDLEMDAADQRSASSAESANAVVSDPDYKAAVTRYTDFLKAHPADPNNDRVLYQLARAYEQGGQLEVALKTLTQLVQQYPKTAYYDEAQFRRGELLFTTRDYVQAEQAYATVLQGNNSTPFNERALYMQGWSLFKQGRLEESLKPLFGVLDLKLAGRSHDGPLDTLKGLTRADRELLDDTFRVTSIALSNLKGAESIPPYIDSEPRRDYEFRVYQQLGELYLKQERTKDAADTLALFARRQPLHAQAPVLLSRVVEIYEQTGFATLALEAKKDYVARYGIESDFRRANPAGWRRAQPLVKTHLTELTRHHHALAQKSKSSADYQEAVRWYRLWLASFPTDEQTPQNHFLLGELLFEDKRFGEAATEYEKVAYDYPSHVRSADAGYAALLGRAEQEKATAPAQLKALQRAGIDSSLRFAKTFPADARAGSVLTNAADKLFAAGDGEQAASVARQALALKPPPNATDRRTAWNVVALNAFDRGQFVEAEKALGEVLQLTADDPASTARRKDVIDRQAAAIYKQGEQARASGQARDAVGHFERIAAIAPQSAVRATAQYDAAAALIGLKDWDAATRLLEDFRQRYKGHSLQGEVNDKLALAYLEQGRWAQAASEFERVASTSSDPQVARSALWQAAELHDKATVKGAPRATAARVYERYVQQHPLPLEPAVEARSRLAEMARKDGNSARVMALMKDIQQADTGGGAARTPRTRTLGGLAALALVEPALDAYRSVPLVEPLARQLKLKKAKMEDVLKAYAATTDYGVAEVTTAATFQTAALYQDFGKSLIGSQRPKKLSKTELEQYNVLLEEQAFPFEEKAIELHETNARRAAVGIYDDWVKKSFTALAQLKPVRYGKAERGEGVIDAIR